MTVRLLLGTEEGLRVGRFDAETGRFRETAAVLAGEAVRALAVDGAATDVGCGLRGRGLHRVTDGEATELGFTDRWVWGVTRHPTRDALYVGTEPAGLWRSTDGGETFTQLPITDVASRDDWQFYHEPFGDGHVHAVTVHPDRPDRLLAGVEDGPTLVSTDAGATWTETLAVGDSHDVVVDPTEPDRWLVATGDGVYETRDAGETWRSLDQFAGRYVHQLVVHPEDSTRLWAYENATPCVHRSDDGGRTWTAVGDGLAPARAADPVAVHPTDPACAVYAGGERTGRLSSTRDGGETWIDATLDDPDADTLPKVWRATATEPVRR